MLMRCTPSVRWMVLAGLLAAMLATALSGCSGGQTSGRDISYVLPDEALRLAEGRTGLLGLSRGEGAVWVDPRSEAAYRAERVPGAISIPFQDVSTRHRVLRGFERIIVYGEDYEDAKAEAMSKRLIELGYDEVYTLRGGLRAWKQAGHETAAGADEADG